MAQTAIEALEWEAWKEGVQDPFFSDLIKVGFNIREASLSWQQVIAQFSSQPQHVKDTVDDGLAGPQANAAQVKAEITSIMDDLEAILSRMRAVRSNNDSWFQGNRLSLPEA